MAGTTPPAGDCGGCGRPMYRRTEEKPTPDAIRVGAAGKCSTCYQRDVNSGRRQRRDHRGLGIGKHHARNALSHSLHRESWTEQAACLEVDPELFFYADEERCDRKAQRDAAAKALCTTCPVVDQCLQWALDNDERHGVWGGTTADERRALLRRRGRAVAS